jgi:hypothetical protein
MEINHTCVNLKKKSVGPGNAYISKNLIPVKPTLVALLSQYFKTLFLSDKVNKVGHERFIRFY